MASSSDVPTMPGQVTVVKEGSRFITLEWPAPSQDNALSHPSIKNYVVFFSTDGGQFKFRLIFSILFLFPQASYKCIALVVCICNCNLSIFFFL